MRTRKPIYLIIEVHTGVAFTRETDLSEAIKVMKRLNDAEGQHYCIQECYR